MDWVQLIRLQDKQRYRQVYQLMGTTVVGMSHFFDRLFSTVNSPSAKKAGSALLDELAYFSFLVSRFGASGHR